MTTTNRATGSYDRNAETARLKADWAQNPRWKNVTRTYSAEDVVRLRGSLQPDNTLARRGAEKLWGLIASDRGFVNAMGVANGSQAVQEVKAGASTIYLSGGQLAGDSSAAETLYPDQSLYATDSLPALVRRINNAFERADQLQWKAGKQPGNADYIDHFAPIVADAQAGRSGVLNAYELMRNMIRAGAAGVHFEDQCAVGEDGQIAGNVLLPTQEAVQNLIAARLAADVGEVPTLILARTAANTELLTSDCDPCDQPFVLGERSDDGFYPIKAGVDQAIARGQAYAPYADVLWLETAEPDLAAAKQFAAAIRREYPEQLLGYNCALSFNWKKSFDDTAIGAFQRELAALGYNLQFVAPASLNNNRIELAAAIPAYALPEKEFAAAAAR
jgi:isocitrate lyase